MERKRTETGWEHSHSMSPGKGCEGAWAPRAARRPPSGSSPHLSPHPVSASPTNEAPPCRVWTQGVLSPFHCVFLSSKKAFPKGRCAAGAQALSRDVGHKVLVPRASQGPLCCSHKSLGTGPTSMARRSKGKDECLLSTFFKTTPSAIAGGGVLLRACPTILSSYPCNMDSQSPAWEQSEDCVG